MSFLKKAFLSASASLPLKYLFKQSGVQLLLPYHHVVSDHPLPHIQNLYSYKGRKAFVEDLDWLVENFTPVQPADLAQHFFSGKPLSSPSFLLSFDDGYREVYDVIAPVLFQKGVPALFFINPAFIDNRELFYRCKLSLVIEKMKDDDQLDRSLCQYFNLPPGDSDELHKRILGVDYNNRKVADELGDLAKIDFDSFVQQHQPFLSSEQIIKLSAQGFVFGAHSWNHPRYPLISINEQLDQTERSLQFVRGLQDNRFQYFAFPHQDKSVSKEFFSQILDREKNLLLFGLQNQRSENGNRILHRYNAEDPRKDLASVTKGILFFNTLLSISGKRTVERQ